jgi:hypothetical protein
MALSGFDSLEQSSEAGQDNEISFMLIVDLKIRFTVTRYNFYINGIS